MHISLATLLLWTTISIKTWNLILIEKFSINLIIKAYIFITPHFPRLWFPLNWKLIFIEKSNIKLIMKSYIFITLYLENGVVMDL